MYKIILVDYFVDNNLGYCTYTCLILITIANLNCNVVFIRPISNNYFHSVEHYFNYLKLISRNYLGENCICGIILDLERAVKKIKETIVLKFNNKNFLILSRSFVLRSFRFVWNNIDSIFHSYVQRKTFLRNLIFCYTANMIW